MNRGFHRELRCHEGAPSIRARRAYRERRYRQRRRRPLLMLLLTSACSPGVESYKEFVTRANPPQPPTLADALAPDTAADLAGLVAENERTLDLLTASRPAAVDVPTADARVAVPLMVQAVRDWSADGVSQRATSYTPLVAGLRERLGAATSTVRVLTPGSGLGRLAFDIAEEFAGSEVVAVEPDVHSQLL